VAAISAPRPRRVIRFSHSDREPEAISPLDARGKKGKKGGGKGKELAGEARHGSAPRPDTERGRPPHHAQVRRHQRGGGKRGTRSTDITMVAPQKKHANAFPGRQKGYRSPLGPPGGRRTQISINEPSARKQRRWQETVPTDHPPTPPGARVPSCPVTARVAVSKREDSPPRNQR